MSRIFLSHSSIDELEAVALKAWLAENGWDDVFLDIDPEPGSWDKTLRLWPAPKVWPDELCAKLTTNMSRKQWSEWVSPEIDYVCQRPGLPIPPDDPNSSAKPEYCPGKPAESCFHDHACQAMRSGRLMGWLIAHAIIGHDDFIL